MNQGRGTPDAYSETLDNLCQGYSRRNWPSGAGFGVLCVLCLVEFCGTMNFFNHDSRLGPKLAGVTQLAAGPLQWSGRCVAFVLLAVALEP